MSYFALQYQDDLTIAYLLRIDDVGVTAYKELHAGAGEILSLFWLLSLVSLVLLSDVESPKQQHLKRNRFQYTHMIHVGYIYLRLVAFNGINVVNYAIHGSYGIHSNKD